MTHVTRRPRPRSLVVRRHTWCFDDVHDRDWLLGSAALSRWFDVYTLLVPDNEAFYIRTLTPCLQWEDVEVKKFELLNFFRQESLHGIAHKAYWKRMSELGIEYLPFLKTVNWILYSIFEPTQSHRMKFAIVAAIEHVNASLGNIVLRRDLLRSANRSLREMFYWHFAEEIEHKAVAHNALARFYPGYITRILGALVAFPSFYLVCFLGMAYFLFKEQKLFCKATLRELFKFWISDGVLRDTVCHLGRYFKRSFEPWDEDDLHLTQIAESMATYTKMSAGDNFAECAEAVTIDAGLDTGHRSDAKQSHG